jgi:hypothetical protein
MPSIAQQTQAAQEKEEAGQLAAVENVNDNADTVGAQNEAAAGGSDDGPKGQGELSGNSPEDEKTREK